MPVKSLPALVDRTTAEAKPGQARLHRHGRDDGPVLVRTPAALAHYGLPLGKPGRPTARPARQTWKR
ncbi:hypothetical protein ACIOKD_15575 [Streptomyces sp. NPDC087844]|uniref:hypothetical protein n=1 Tax=Streptomyces sp. NPDC087844 TaxID=3365805 RepID=UPI003816F78D